MSNGKVVIMVDPDLPPNVQEVLRKAVERRRLPELDNGSGLRAMSGMQIGLLVGIISPETVASVGGIGGAMALGTVGMPLVWIAIPRVHKRILTQRKARAAYRAGRWKTSEIGWEEGEKLIIRASESIQWVIGSLVHRDGQIDTVHNNVALPRQLWTLMSDIAELQGHRENRPDKDSPLTATHDKVVEQIRVNCERRVQALETYAQQVMIADKRYAELLSVELLESKSSSLMDLLARTSAVDHDVSDLGALTDEASRLVESYQTALAAAREAGLALTASPA